MFRAFGATVLLIAAAVAATSVPPSMLQKLPFTATSSRPPPIYAEIKQRIHTEEGDFTIIRVHVDDDDHLFLLHIGPKGEAIGTVK